MAQYMSVPSESRCPRAPRSPGWRALGTALLAASFASLPATASASPVDIFGWGPRTQAMGMTGASYASDFEAVYSNPAGLGQSRSMGLAIGVTLGDYEINLRETVNGMNPVTTSSGLVPVSATAIGFYLPLGFGGVLKDVLVLGGAFYTPMDTVLRNDILFYDTPQFPVLNRAQTVSLMAGLGINLGNVVEGLRLGIGASALASNIGDLDIQLEGTRVVSLTESQITTTYAPIAGMQFDRDIGDTANLAFGLTYRGELRSEAHVNITIDPAIPLPLPTLRIDALAQFDPHTIVGEVGLRLADDRFLIAVQGTYRRWSTWPGSSGPTSEFSRRSPAPNFKDTISPRVGLEYTILEGGLRLALRAGYAFEPTPAPAAACRQPTNNDGTPSVWGSTSSTPLQPLLVPNRSYDSSRHVITLGTGFTWQTKTRASIVASLFGQLHHLSPRMHRFEGQRCLEPGTSTSTDPPTPAEMARWSDTSTVRSWGWLAMFGWTVGVDW